jgi:hypothetical protein
MHSAGAAAAAKDWGKGAIGEIALGKKEKDHRGETAPLSAN